MTVNDIQIRLILEGFEPSLVLSEDISNLIESKIIEGEEKLNVKEVAPKYGAPAAVALSNPKYKEYFMKRLSKMKGKSSPVQKPKLTNKMIGKNN